MARQCGIVLFEGTLGNLTGYQVNGKFYVRRKSEVERRRILTHPRFANTRRNAAWFARAQKLASAVYLEIRRMGQSDLRSTWYPLRNRAQELVRKELTEQEIMLLLRKEFLEPLLNKVPTTAQRTQRSDWVSSEKTEKAFTEPEKIFLGRTVNQGLIPDLIDQLAAGSALLKNLLERDKSVSVFGREKRGLGRVLRRRDAGYGMRDV